MKRKGAVLSLVVAAVAALIVWWSQGGMAGQPADHTSNAGSSTTQISVSIGGSGGTGTVAVSALPEQARQTLALIDRGGPFPYVEDGTTFENFEGHLPSRPSGYYKEYTVDTPGSSDRGARRIIAGADGELYYTADHYNSFERIDR